MNLRHFRYFVAVAEERHFHRAAERLRVSQPGLSLQIKELEQELGVRLLERSNRKVIVTEEGEIFLRRSRAILESVAEAQKEMQTLSLTGGGLRIGYMSAAMATSLVPLLKELRADHQDFALGLRQMTPEAQLRAVASGALDAGFVDLDASRSTVNIEDKLLVIERAWRENLVAALPLDHPLAKAKSVRIDQLEREPLIVLARSQLFGFFDHVISLCLKAGFRPRIAHEVNELPEVMTLVAAGYGVSFAPERSSAPWKDQLALVPLKESISTDVSIVYRVDNRSKMLLRLREAVGKAAKAKAAARASKIGPRAL